MESAAALVRSAQIKQRLAGVTQLFDILQAPEISQPLAYDGEYLSSLFADILPCLRDNNSKVSITTLAIIEMMVPRVSDATIKNMMKMLWMGLVERLGDSKLQVREKAVDVVVALAYALGELSMLERLKSCIGHKNWRTREQTLYAFWRCMEMNAQIIPSLQPRVLDDIVALLDDSTKEVRDAAMAVLANLHTHMGPALVYELESKNIRSGHMRMLLDKFKQPVIKTEMKRPQRAKLTVQINEDNITMHEDDGPPMSATARFLSAIKNKQFNFDNVSTDSSEQTIFPPLISSNVATDSAILESISSHVADEMVPSSINLILSDRDIHRELTKIADGLKLDNNWSIRVDSLKNLQRLAHRCRQSDKAALTSLSQGFRSLREVTCEQVSDLRSSVAREACVTLQILATVLRDEFNSHAEYCIVNLLKATYVTIQVISTAAETSIREIIGCTKLGYNRLINKFIDGAKTRNQALRLNCVAYLTLTLEKWSVSFLIRHLDIIQQILPSLLHDAFKEVRTRARGCYWAFHAVFPQEADELCNSLDLSTQKNLRDETMRERQLSPNKNQLGVGSSGRMTLIRKESFKSTDTASSDASTDDGTQSTVASRVLSSSNFGQGSKSNPCTSTHLSGALRVLENGIKASGGDQQRGILSSRLGSGALRVECGVRNTTSDSSQPLQRKPVGGALRVEVKPLVPRAERVQLSCESNASGPVPRKDRTNSSKRRAVALSADQEGIMKSSVTQSVEATQSTVSQPSSDKDVPLTVKGSNQLPPPPPPLSVQESIDDALTRIENGLWSVRLEAVELIERSLDKPLSPTKDVDNNNVSIILKAGKKVDERVLTALIRHLTDPHYRVAQAAMKSLFSYLQVSTQSLVGPHLKLILPKLFHKFVDPKESIRTIAREILELLVVQFDASSLLSHIVPLLTDGVNMKMKTAICRYMKELLPGAAEYLQKQSNNCNNMRVMLSKVSQLMEGDVPVSVSIACGDIVQVTSELYPRDVENALQLLAPNKRATLAKVLRSRGIVFSVNQTASSMIENAKSHMDDDESNQFNREIKDTRQPAPNRKRQAQSPLRGSPIVTTPDEIKSANKELRDIDNNLRALSDFSSKLSPSPVVSPSPSGKQLEDLFAEITNNNSTDDQRSTAYRKLAIYITSESDEFWEDHFPKVLSLLLETANERDPDAIRVLLKLLRAQPHRAREYFHPVLLGLLEVVHDVNLTSHLAELALIEVVRVSSLTSQALDYTLSLLIPLVETRQHPSLQTVLILVRTALESVNSNDSQHTTTIALASASRLLSVLVRLLHHDTSEIRKRAVDCMVAFHFMGNNEKVLYNYLEQHVDVVKRKLIERCIDQRVA